MSISKQKLIGIIISSLCAVTALTINRLYKSYSKSSYIPQLTRGLIREKLFNKEYISTSELNNLLSYEEINGKYEFKLNEEELNNTFKSWLIEKIQSKWNQKGKNLRNLSGRVYYEIKSEELLVLVLWKSNPDSRDYTHFDQISLNFKNNRFNI